MEHPFSPSWGYQVTGYFAPTSRFGTPDDFMYFVDACHQAGIGVIVDWVPAHFPKDAHGLAYFDGTALYEHADPRQGEHRDWGTLIFNYGRNEVRTFLISNALFWLKKYHIDGLRVDAVASMLYLDYSRKAGEWIPNIYGGNENLEAIDFLRRFNELAHQVPGAMTIAEESTAFPGVSRPVYLNGLGFTMKWNMGWMHDMLDYFEHDPVHRKYHHNEHHLQHAVRLHGEFRAADFARRSGARQAAAARQNAGRRVAAVRQRARVSGYMYGASRQEAAVHGLRVRANGRMELRRTGRWWLLQFPVHQKLKTFCAAINQLYRSEPAMYEIDFQYKGFEWIDFHDADNSIVVFVRRAKRSDDYLVFACNFTPQPHFNYRLGFPEAGLHREIFNSDAEIFGGSNLGNGGAVKALKTPSHGRPASAEIIIPPLGVVVFKPARPSCCRLKLPLQTRSRSVFRFLTRTDAASSRAILS